MVIPVSLTGRMVAITQMEQAVEKSYLGKAIKMLIYF